MNHQLYNYSCLSSLWLLIYSPSLYESPPQCHQAGPSGLSALLEKAVLQRCEDSAKAWCVKAQVSSLAQARRRHQWLVDLMGFAGEIWLVNG